LSKREYRDQMIKDAGDLIDFIDDCPSRFHVVNKIASLLELTDVEELDIKRNWQLEKGGTYFLRVNDSALVAFYVGTGDVANEGFKIVGAHTDSPAIRIKPNPVMKVEDHYAKFNTELYGGPIVHTWFDRPLGFAGRITLKDKTPTGIRSELVEIKDKKVIIPNLAIHMNREVNKQFSPDKQKELTPLAANLNESLQAINFEELLAEYSGDKKEDIIDYEVFLHDYSPGEIIGLDNEMISSSQLDDLAMVHAALKAFIYQNEQKEEPAKESRVVVFFDNEEIGSATMQGANSPMLSNILERITLALGKGREGFLRSLQNSFMISADMAHALHPNKSDVHDPTNHPFINNGPVIKISSNFRYTSDSESSAIFERLCRLSDIPVQRFVNHSNERGGSTIGPILTSKTGIKAVDIGNPMLAMHSIRELAGVDDHYYMIEALKNFFS